MLGPAHALPERDREPGAHAIPAVAQLKHLRGVSIVRGSGTKRLTVKLKSARLARPRRHRVHHHVGRDADGLDGQQRAGRQAPHEQRGAGTSHTTACSWCTCTHIQLRGNAAYYRPAGECLQVQVEAPAPSTHARRASHLHTSVTSPWRIRVCGVPSSLPGDSRA